jgi:hypothetical protein
MNFLFVYHLNVFFRCTYNHSARSIEQEGFRCDIQNNPADQTVHNKKRKIQTLSLCGWNKEFWISATSKSDTKGVEIHVNPHNQIRTVS